MERMMIIVADPVKAMLIKIWGYIPTLVAALIILVVGWLIAKLIETIAIRMLKMIRLDGISDKAGITKVLAQGDIKVSLSELIGAIIYWVVILVSVATALNALNLVIAADVLSKFIKYIPNVLGAIFILVLGMFLANLVSTIVKTAAGNAGINNAKGLAEIAKWILVVFAVVAAIEQLGIGVAILNLAVSIILASIGLGLALAFGLGCKDMAAKTLSDMVNKLKK